jgi:hypothetical protein
MADWRVPLTRPVQALAQTGVLLPPDQPGGNPVPGAPAAAAVSRIGSAAINSGRYGAHEVPDAGYSTRLNVADGLFRMTVPLPAAP